MLKRSKYSRPERYGINSCILPGTYLKRLDTWFYLRVQLERKFPGNLPGTSVPRVCFSSSPSRPSPPSAGYTSASASLSASPPAQSVKSARSVKYSAYPRQVSQRDSRVSRPSSRERERERERGSGGTAVVEGVTVESKESGPWELSREGSQIIQNPRWTPNTMPLCPQIQGPIM